MSTLQGRRAIVTGAAGGIGEAIARGLAAEGATVAILDIREDAGTATAKEIGGHYLPVDLADADAARRVTADAVDALGGIDILVNNAGILRFGSILELTVSDWDETFAINTRAMLITTQVVASRMIEDGGGKIINLASMAGKSGGQGQAHYAASKAAVIAFTRVTALEFGDRGITANALCPGYVLTEMGAATRTEEDVATWSAFSPLGRLAVPQDVASVATFLASPASDYMTGQAINVTGGMIMH